MDKNLTLGILTRSYRHAGLRRLLPVEPTMAAWLDLHREITVINLSMAERFAKTIDIQREDRKVMHAASLIFIRSAV